MANAPHILLIEDETIIADTLSFTLQREGMQVQWCALASDGEARLAGGEIDLVILDVGLPDANGLDVLKRIRRHSDLPVILLTARTDEMDRILGLELGADDYVGKPFSPREVAARVKTVLKRFAHGRNIQPAASGANLPLAASTPPGAAACPGTLAFRHDAAALRIAWHDQWLSLTPSEYRVLLTLLGRPGQVFSRMQLLDALGDTAAESLERTIDSHIKSLRAKLRVIGESANVPREAIETHRSFGYSLRPEC